MPAFRYWTHRRAAPVRLLVLLAVIPRVLGAASPALGQAVPSQGTEVTLTGNVLSDAATGTRGKSLFLIAYDGTADVKAEFDRIMADYPDQGLDADTALKIQDAFMTRLRYEINLTEPIAEGLYKPATYTVRQAQIVTGVVAEKDGKKWVTLRKAVPTDFKFPAKMLAPDRPFIMPNREPLVLKISDRLTYKCLYVPAGKFLMGEPYYQCRHWQEDPPHLVTLTKGYYLAEHPVTQEIYEAIMGENPAKEKDPRLPVTGVDCVHMYEFCEKLAARTGRKIGVPTAAQWEYAARVGTSNPTFAVKYQDQSSNAGPAYNSGPLPVKSKRPNPWGFYDMSSGGWERIADAANPIRQDEVDPVHLPPQDQAPETRGNKHSHFGKGQWTYEISEVEYISSEAGPYRFRIVVADEAAAPAQP